MADAVLLLQTQVIRLHCLYPYVAGFAVHLHRQAKLILDALLKIGHRCAGGKNKIALPSYLRQ